METPLKIEKITEQSMEEASLVQYGRRYFSTRR
jgi:hypothetical protein